jgi:diacylglycerol kinase family enzyme
VSVGKPRRALIIHNAKSGRASAADAVDRLARALGAAGLVPEVETDLARLAARVELLVDSGELAALVAAGGDGTVRTAAEVLAGRAPLAVLPAGTENLVARQCGFMGGVDRLVRAIARGATQWLDAGRADGRLFLVMASIGFDATVVERVHSRRRGHVRRRDYFLALLAELFHYRFPALRVRLFPASETDPTSVREFLARWLFTFNLPRYAGGLRLAPDARADDGRLECVTFRRGGICAGLGYYARLALGRPQPSSDFRTTSFTRVEVTAERPVAYQFDGEAGGTTPVTIEVVPRAVRMIVVGD